MKKPIKKRRNSVLALGVLISALLAVFLHRAMARDAFQHDFDMIQVGMPLEEATAIVSREDSGAVWGDFGPYSIFTCGESESDIVPGRTIALKADPETGRIVRKTMHYPTVSQYCMYWLRKWRVAKSSHEIVGIEGQGSCQSDR